jgi:hypothetical protein
MFKNLLVASGVRPKFNFILTKDNSLTNPHLMVFPKAFANLPPQGRDPLVDRLVFVDMSPANALALPLGAHVLWVGLRRWAEAGRQRLGRALDWAGPLLTAIQLLMILTLGNPDAVNFIYYRF